MTVPYDCHRCLLRVDVSMERQLSSRARDWKPDGWEVRLVGPKKEVVWWCKTCVKEVALGSPETL